MTQKFVICGVEHSGTTLVSDVFRQVPGLDSGFEVGVLLSKSPKEFRTLEPFISNMKAGWGLTDSQLDDICDTSTFEKFYQRLRKISDVIDESSEIFDKTPRYFSQLQCCLDKVSYNFVATYKDPRSLVYSDYKRAKPEDFDKWFEEYAPKKLRYLTAIYKQYKDCKHYDGSRVAFVSLEDIALNTRRTFDKIFSVVDVDFNIEYLMLKNMRYKNTKVAYVSSKIPFEYMDFFDKKRENSILDRFSMLKDWIYE